MKAFSDHDTRVHGQALKAFRRRHAFRRLRTCIAAFCAFSAFLIAFRRPDVPPPELPSPGPVALVSSTKGEGSPILDDQQLLQSFPPGSCFLAEVNGRKILVFTDPAVEKLYLN